MHLTGGVVHSLQRLMHSTNQVAHLTRIVAHFLPQVVHLLQKVMHLVRFSSLRTMNICLLFEYLLYCLQTKMGVVYMKVLKKWSPPIKLRKYEVLQRRLRTNHPKMPTILSELNKRKSGYHGELSLHYPLTFLHDKDYYVLHGLRLPNHIGHFFQIDTLLYSSTFISIPEVKSHKGILTFDENFKQLLQNVDGTRIGYEDPNIQIDRHVLQLEHWLKHNGFPPIPIEPLIVISNPSTIIETTGDPKNYTHIIHKNQLPFKIFEFETKYQRHAFSKQEMNRLGRELLKQHTPEQFDILKHLNIHPREILPGVHCPQCNHLSIDRQYRKWKCPQCMLVSKTAFIEALKEYCLLFGPSITNKQCKYFLNLSSRTLVTNLLTSLNLPYSGENRGRIYYLDGLL